MPTFLTRAALVALAAAALALPAPAAAQPPSIVFVLTDDQRAGTIQVMPRTRDAFALRFPQFVVTTSNCCPSRSTLLTGRYVHNTGVLASDASGYEAFKALEPESLAPWLRARGYRTGFVGKYFNGYERDDPVPPGWDEFHGRLYGADRGNGTTAFALRHFRKEGEVVVQDEVVSYPNEDEPEPYATRVFGTLAESFLRRAADPATNPEGKPFALFLWTIGPNTALPEPLYAAAPLPPWRKPPSFLERDLRDKPREIRKSGRITPQASFHAGVRASQLRQLMTIDDVVGGLVDLLAELELEDETWGIFSSDNGRLWGEHQLRGKVYAYEESVRVPFRLMLPTGRSGALPAFAASIDVAPTIAALAGDDADHGYDGRSLLPLLAEGAPQWPRRNVLLEHFGRPAVRYDGLRNHRWTYVRWPVSGRQELYDRRKDPYQLENVAATRSQVAKRLAARVRILAESRAG